MGFFSNILEKLGIGGKDATPTTTFTPTASPAAVPRTDAAQAGSRRRCRREIGAASGS